MRLCGRSQLCPTFRDSPPSRPSNHFPSLGEPTCIFCRFLCFQHTTGGTKGISIGTPQHIEDEQDLLSNIIQTLNDTYGIDLTDDDKVDMGRMQEKLHAREDLRAVMHSNNTVENKQYIFGKVVDELLLDFVRTKLDLYKKLSDPKVNPMFKSKWFEGYLRENRPEAGGGASLP